MEADDAEPVARVWIEFLDRYEVPAAAYPALYDRAVDALIRMIQNGKDPGELTAETILAGWIGENGLRAELERKRIEEKRYLPDTAASACPRCFGLGWEYIYSAEGKKEGARPKCKHEPLKPGEWLWKQQQKDDEFEGEPSADVFG